MDWFITKANFLPLCKPRHDNWDAREVHSEKEESCCLYLIGVQHGTEMVQELEELVELVKAVPDLCLKAHLKMLNDAFLERAYKRDGGVRYYVFDIGPDKPSRSKARGWPHGTS